MPPGSRIRKFFEVFIDFQQDFRLFIELIYNDLDPEQTRELQKWEKQFNLAGSGTEADRQQALLAAWRAKGGQSGGYLQDLLHEAGFENIFVHESFYYDGDQRIIRDPTQILGGGYQPAVIFGNSAAVCGSSTAVCGARAPGGGYFLLNGGLGRTIRKPIAATVFGNYQAVFGNIQSVCGSTRGIEFIPEKYQPPSDPPAWRFFYYLGAENFPDFADLSADRKIEFERFVLKYFPKHLWAGILVNYV